MSLTIENNILMKNGKPFFYLADTCWSAFTNIKDNDWDYYLDYRKSQGFNTLQINILPQWDASATDLCYEPFEVIDGKYKINYKPAKKLPIEEFLRPQKRFKHMFKPGNEWMIEEFQKEVDARWQELLDLEEITNR